MTGSLSINIELLDVCIFVPQGMGVDVFMLSLTGLLAPGPVPPYRWKHDKYLNPWP